MTISAGTPEFVTARRLFHAALLNSVLRMDASGVATNADKDSRLSVALAADIYQQLATGTAQVTGMRLAGQTSGSAFEDLVKLFLEATFQAHLQHLRPGQWRIQRTPRSRKDVPLADYEQYRHLADLQTAVSANRRLRAIVEQNYIIAPDVVVVRQPEDDHAINAHALLIDQTVARRSSLRKGNNPYPLLHASISTKWTLRSDRAQNARSEALSLIRNRKGRLPHVVVVTGEPLPSRIASLALGTGDMDCVYHFALDELCQAVNAGNHLDAKDLLEVKASV